MNDGYTFRLKHSPSQWSEDTIDSIDELAHFIVRSGYTPLYNRVSRKDQPLAPYVVVERESGDKLSPSEQMHIMQHRMVYAGRIAG